MREVVIKCDGCGTIVPGGDEAHYTVQLICLSGPNRDPVQPPPRDLCGYCANLVRVIIDLQERESGRVRPNAVELVRRGPGV